MYSRRISTNISSVSRPSMAALPGRAVLRFVDRELQRRAQPGCPIPGGTTRRAAAARIDRFDRRVVIAASHEQHRRQRLDERTESLIAVQVPAHEARRSPTAAVRQLRRLVVRAGRKDRRQRRRAAGAVTAHGVLIAAREHDRHRRSPSSSRDAPDTRPRTRPRRGCERARRIPPRASRPQPACPGSVIRSPTATRSRP